MDKYIDNLFRDIEVVLCNSLKSLEIQSELYVCGFWLFYCDYSVIYPPCFGYNSLCEEEEDRWSPPEWDVDIEESVYETLEPLYKKLTNFMNGKPDKDWETLIKYQWQFYSSFCFTTNSSINSTESIFKNWSKNKDFVISIFEEREGEEIFNSLVKQSIGVERAKQLCII